MAKIAWPKKVVSARRILKLRKRIERKFVQLQLLLRWPREKIILDKVLQSKSAATVFTGVIGGREVIVKKFWDRELRKHEVSGTQKALSQFKHALRGHRHSVNKFVLGSPKLGVIVVSYENGETVEDVLKQPKQVGRIDLIRLCCEWFNASTQGRQTFERFDGRKMSKELKKRWPSNPNPDDHKLLVALHAALKELAQSLDQQKLCRAPSHPDFAGRNLLLQESKRIVAVDIHRVVNVAVSRSAANFLVSKDSSIQVRSDKSWYGLRLDELKVFLESGIVPKSEIGTFFRYFVGLYTLRLYCHAISSRRGLQLRRQKVKAYLADFEQEKQLALM